MEIRQVEMRFPASNGEGEIFTRGWLVDFPIALVQIAHGMSEHSGRYKEFATMLCAHGYSIVANDHAGHGHSSFGHPGTFALKSGGFDFAVEDINRSFEFAESQIGKYPRILIGHSMGGVLAALYADRYDDLAALIMIGLPAPIAFGGMAIRIAERITRKYGYTARSPLLEKLSGSTQGLSGEALEQKEEWLTRDLEKIREFISDPLCGFDFTASGYSELLRGIKRIASKEWGAKIPNIPVLVAAGAEDTVGKKGKGPRKYETQLRATGHSDVTLKLFPESRHEILNELDRADVYSYICDWLTLRFAERIK